MQKNYETVFILNPVLSDEQIKETVSKYRNIIKDSGAEIINDYAWGIRKLAYPIKKKTSGYYHLFEMKADTSFIANLELQYKRDENVLRFLTVALDKHAVEYNNKFRSKRTNKQTQE